MPAPPLPVGPVRGRAPPWPELQAITKHRRPGASRQLSTQAAGAGQQATLNPATAAVMKTVGVAIAAAAAVLTTAMTTASCAASTLARHCLPQLATAMPRASCSDGALVKIACADRGLQLVYHLRKLRRYLGYKASDDAFHTTAGHICQLIVATLETDLLAPSERLRRHIERRIAASPHHRNTLFWGCTLRPCASRAASTCLA